MLQIGETTCFAQYIYMNLNVSIFTSLYGSVSVYANEKGLSVTLKP